MSSNISDIYQRLKSNGYSNEYILDSLVESEGVLLHGSRVDISDNYIRPNNKGEVFATDLASIAILKAIVSNRGLIHPGLQYDWIINEENPLVLKIHGIREFTIGSVGFVYIIPDRNGFRNEPEGSWQYIKKGSRAHFSFKIEVSRDDFTYPIYDVTNRRKIQ